MSRTAQNTAHFCVEGSSDFKPESIDRLIAAELLHIIQNIEKIGVCSINDF